MLLVEVKGEVCSGGGYCGCVVVDENGGGGVVVCFGEC